MNKELANIGLFTSVYFNNIGNGFIDLGAEATINAVKSDNFNLVKISQCANFAASLGRMFAIRENVVVSWVWENIMSKFAGKLHDRTYNAVSSLDVFSVVKIIKLDYLIIPGCVLTVPFFTLYGKLLEEKVKQGCKLIFLGASGNYYTKYEFETVSKYLRSLKPYAIMTRDSVAFKHYAHMAKYAYNGIDNVFFVNRLNIPKLDTTETPYVIINLENKSNGKIKKELESKYKGKNIIYTDHKPFPYTKISNMVKQGKTMISDYPLDYLTLYRNADIVYSDRVHACIPTLSFGNKAVLYSESPRKALFKNVGVDKITTEPMEITNLEERQNKQIEFLKSILQFEERK